MYLNAPTSILSCCTVVFCCSILHLIIKCYVLCCMLIVCCTVHTPGTIKAELSWADVPQLFHCRRSLPSWSHLCAFSGMPVKCKYMKNKLKWFQQISDFYDLCLRAPNVSDWSDKGCRVLHTGPNGTSCFCNHTTNFAILMNYMEARVRHWKCTLYFNI